MSANNFTKTTAGAPMASDEHSRTVGAEGPVVLNDVYLVEKLEQFNRERAPERVAHAKGGGALVAAHDGMGAFESHGELPIETLLAGRTHQVSPISA